MITSPTLYQTPWKNLKEQIGRLNPWLAHEINKVPNSDNFSMIVARYPFGQFIIDKGKFHVWHNNTMLPFENDLIPRAIKKQLDYSWQAIPFGIVTHGSMESHIDYPNPTIPFRLLTPGKTFSLLTVFESTEASALMVGLYSNTSGCRSLTLLPKITHEYSYNRMSRLLGMKQAIMSRNLSDQWPLFCTIIDAPAFKTNWYCELAFFSKDFLKKDATLFSLHDKLRQSIWESTSLLRNKYCIDFLWSVFLEDLPLTDKNNIYLIESAKQIVKIAMGEVPAMVPACNDISAPVSELMHVFSELYKIRYHHPIFMHLEHFSGRTPVYYSLHKPTFQHIVPSKIAPRKTVQNTQKLADILARFRLFVASGESGFDLKGSLLHRVLEEVEFDYYHPLSENKKINKDIAKMIAEDERFQRAAKLVTMPEEVTYPIHALFFNGCVRIRPIVKRK